MKNRLIKLVQYWGLWLGSYGAASLVLMPLMALIKWEFPGLFLSAVERGQDTALSYIVVFLYSMFPIIFAYLWFRVRLPKLIFAFFTFNLALSGFVALSNTLMVKAGGGFAGMQYFWDLAKGSFYYVMVGQSVGAVICLLFAVTLFKRSPQPAPGLHIEGRSQRLSNLFGATFWVFCLFGLAQVWQPFLRLVALGASVTLDVRFWSTINAVNWAAIVLQTCTMGLLGYLVPQERRGTSPLAISAAGLLYIWILTWTQVHFFLLSLSRTRRENWDLEADFYFNMEIILNWAAVIAVPLIAFWFFQRPRPQSPISTVPNPLAHRNRELS